MYEVKTSQETHCRKYDVNGKAAMAILVAGVGTSHLNTILVTLNIPPVYDCLLKRYERDIGVEIEEVAQESCRESLKIEKTLTINNLRLQDPESHIDEVIDLTLSYDAGWQKKGAGRTYNSLTGHSTAIGYFSRLIVAYTTRNKRCVKCEKGLSKEDHDCRLNFYGSSKAMEPDMTTELFLNNNNFVAEGVRLGTLIGDEDSSTIARLRRESNHQILKWTDVNHATSALSRKLYALKCLSSQVVLYFKYCFGCILKCNKDNASATKQALLNIVPHAFDDHKNCEQWCGYKKNPEQYTHKLLPGGKGLAGEELKKKIQKVFEHFANNAEKLAPCGSSQANESMNMKIASKAPKTRHYGGSESNDFRVSTAICEENVGFTFIQRVNDKLQYSPLTKRSLEFLKKKDNIKRIRAANSKTAPYKKRRRELFKARSSVNTNAENREGISYQSQSGIDIGVEFIDQPIPEKYVNISSNDNSAIVVFDLETTGFGRNAEIVQIGAKHGDREYDAYMLPTIQISSRASEVTGITTKDGKLYVDSVQVSTITPKMAVNNFISFLRMSGSKVILVAHNCIRFDGPKILKLIEKENMLAEFSNIIHGFCDTLPLFQNKLLERKSLKLSFGVLQLANEYLKKNEIKKAHNAIGDVTMLHNLIFNNQINLSLDDLKSSVIPIQYFQYVKRKSAVVASLIPELSILQQSSEEKKSNLVNKEKSGLSSGMIKKIAEAGISLKELKEAYSTNGTTGITILLGQDVGGKPRVTKSKAIINAIIKKLIKISE